jgi:RNA polymerase sigma-70 factor (ECF subfamily)
MRGRLKTDAKDIAQIEVTVDVDTASRCLLHRPCNKLRSFVTNAHCLPVMLGLQGDVANRCAVAVNEPTEQLLRRIRGGEEAARQALYERCLPLLRRWAHGRLPHQARDVADTDDLVQITLLRALRHLEEFEASGSGSFLAYLRQILLNEVRAELRKRRRHGDKIDIETVPLADESASVAEQLVGQERWRNYERALAELDRHDQALIVLRLEFGLGYPEIALETGSTANAVRMRVTRALKVMTDRIAELQG